jgi:glycosyltransferase involved in cell wall biosynthesis
MKIAYVVPYVPNQIRTRSYNLILSLTSLGHSVDVFTLGSGIVDENDVAALRSKCCHVYYQHQPIWRSLVNSTLAVPSSKPLQSVYSWHPNLAAQLKAQLPKYDLVHVEHLRGSQYGKSIKAYAPSMPVVWDSVDCITHLFKQASSQSGSILGKLMTRFELGRTRNAEGRLLGAFNHVLVTSSTDRSALLDIVPDGVNPSPVTVLSNGVDQGYFRPNLDIERDPDTLVFSGKMSYHANISMVMYLFNEIMPRLWAKRPGVRLVVVGKDPPAEIQKLADSSRVHITGTVDDIRPYLWKATAAVVPLVYGAGVQNKILEAMATATPVITNSKVLSSLDVIPGRELLVADSAEDFALCALRLFENPALQRTIGYSGLEYVRKNHNWDESAQQMVDIYGQLITQQAGRAS